MCYTQSHIFKSVALTNKHNLHSTYPYLLCLMSSTPLAISAVEALEAQIQVNEVSTVGKDAKRTKRIEKAMNGQVAKKSKSDHKTPEETEGSNELVDFKTKTKSNTTSNTREVTIQKKTLHESVLSRPDTYIGSIVNSLTTDPVYTIVSKTVIDKHMDEEGNESEVETPRIFEGIGKSQVELNNGLLRIFVEVVSNAIDNIWNSGPSTNSPVQKFIKIEVTPTKCSVWNDGRNIPTRMHGTENIPTPELIFGHLLTSSNYNDTEERKTSGRNGYGVKLTNIFSKRFKVTIFNKEEGVMYKQEWLDNMHKRGAPLLEKKNFPKTVEDGKNGFTCVEWEPDFARFGCTSFSADMMNMMKKVVYDTAMTASIDKVSVLFNGAVMPISKMTDYVNLYFLSPPKNVISLQTDDCYVVVAPSNEWCPVSFVNGVYTKDGGVHVDRWAEALFRPLIDKLNETLKGKTVDMREIKKHFFLFVFASLNQPKFDTQDKHRLNSPAIEVDVKPAIVAKMMKWDFVKQIEESMKLKEMLTFQKESERKKGVRTRVEGLEDANYAGTKKADCVLFITEGLSAKTTIVTGMKYGCGPFKGRDTIGVLPIRGKFLNVKNASAAVLSKNKELLGITKTIGVVYGTDYSVDENFAKLRYKKLICATDADHDGSHITGLLYNLFHSLYPTLLERKDFFCFMRVPIIKITPKGAAATISKKNKQPAVLNFYNLNQAKQYITQNNVPSTAVKYFKGLGTLSDKDLKYDFGKRIVQVVKDTDADRMMENVFGGDESDFRKTWIQNYKVPETFVNIPEGQIENLNISDFLNQELIQYSIDHCRRSIPSVIDGLKESGRKVLHAAFMKNLKFAGESLKVAQFSNYVAEKTHYHHGEQNLYDTITKMAQRFTGSNNLPMFYNDGQFGSRVENGKDAADPRYIFTKLDMCTRSIFREEDEDFLTVNIEEGYQVEPVNFAPIVPMVLINGVQGGIGTGWSSNVPPHNVLDIIDWIKAWLNQQPTTTLRPYYRGFTGNIRVEGHKIFAEGILNQQKQRWVVSEIPIGKRMTSICRYKTKLEGLEDDNKVNGIINQSTENKPYFTFLAVKEFTPTLENMGLIDVSYTSNMVLFDPKNRLKRYGSTDEIMEEWCLYRFQQYNVRKEGMMAKLKHDSQILYNKIRFLELVIANKIVLKDKEEDQLIAELKQLKFDALPDFDYLLSIQIRQMTSKYLKDMKTKYANLVDTNNKLAETPIKTIWMNELEELVKVYDKWVKEQDQTSSDE